MYVKKLNFVLYLALALVVGFGSSFLFGNVNVEQDQLSGDISKASVYSNAQMQDPEASIVEEKLKNDSTYRQITQVTMELLKERVEIAGGLCQKSIKVCSEIPELSMMLTSFKSLQAKTHNTGLAIEAASDGIQKIISGKSAPEYETASNNTYIGYQKIAGQLEVSKEFVNEAMKYVENGGEKSQEVSELISEWTRYNVQDALLNNSKEDLVYWDEKLSDMDESMKGFLGSSSAKNMLNDSPVAKMILKANNAKELLANTGQFKNLQAAATNLETLQATQTIALPIMAAEKVSVVLSNNSMKNLVNATVGRVILNNMTNNMKNLNSNSQMSGNFE